jgi:hypothetical protein
MEGMGFVATQQNAPGRGEMSVALGFAGDMRL